MTHLHRQKNFKIPMSLLSTDLRVLLEVTKIQVTFQGKRICLVLLEVEKKYFFKGNN